MSVSDVDNFGGFLFMDHLHHFEVYVAGSFQNSWLCERFCGEQPSVGESTS